MKHWFFAGKRCLSSISFPVMLFMIAALLPFAARLGRVSGQLPAGVVDLDKSGLSERVSNALQENGFVIYETEEALEYAVGNSQADCGIVLPEGFSRMTEQAETERSIRVICSLQSTAKDMYLGHVTAAIFAEVAPYITAKELAPFGIPAEEVLKEYHTMLSDGYVFSFDILTEEGLPVPENVHAESLMTGVTAVLLYIACSVAATGLVHKEMQSVALRIGKRRAVSHVLIPGITIRLLLLGLAVTAGLLLAEPVTDGFCEKSLLVPALLYSIVITVFALGLSLLCRDSRVLYLLLFAVLTASVVLCPIYIDVTVLSPALEKIRNLVPVYWLWKICLIF